MVRSMLRKAWKMLRAANGHSTDEVIQESERLRNSIRIMSSRLTVYTEQLVAEVAKQTGEKR